MADFMPQAALTSPSAALNRGPILSVLKRRLPPGGMVLEIAAGTGEHAIFNAAGLPMLQWQPTEAEPAALASVEAWRKHANLANLLPALPLNAATPDTWPVKYADAIVNINMIHISPWAASIGLMTGAGRLLPTGGLLYLYGPFIERDIETMPSNLAFDASLKARNAAWGLRQLEDVTALAAIHGLELSERVAMPANNLSLIFQKTAYPE